MKWILLFLMIIVSVHAEAQKKIRINAKKNISGLEKMEIVINGNSYFIDTLYNTIILPQEHQFDTLEINPGGIKVLCNFENDSSYTLIGACCASTDIVPSWKCPDSTIENIEELSDEAFYEQHEANKQHMMDRPQITFKIENGSSKDSIYAWYADHASFPSFKLIDEEGWQYGSPIKGFYWSNISFFEFFKSTRDFKALNTKHPDGTIHWMMNEQGIVEDVYPDYDQDESLGTIATRLFGNNHYTITYDLLTKQITLTKDD